VSVPVRVPIGELRAGDRTLEREASHYLVAVHRLRAGDTFVGFDPESATEAEALVIEADARSALCRFGAPEPARLLPSFSVTLVQALGKGEATEQVIRAATALGARRVTLVVAERSVARPSPEGGRLARWRSIALAAARQSGRGDIPELEGPRPALEVIGEWRARTARKLCLQPGAERSLHSALESWRDGEPVSLMVGPEGGWSSPELAAAEQAGFSRVRLGALVLRTELAGVAALGAVLCAADDSRRVNRS
jgi:16S rRNA (uracil1498-N3)-methyltransferase